MTTELEKAEQAYNEAESAYIAAAVEANEVITIGSHTIYPTLLAIAKEIGYDDLEDEDAREEALGFLKNHYYTESDLPLWVSSSDNC